MSITDIFVFGMVICLFKEWLVDLYKQKKAKKKIKNDNMLKEMSYELSEHIFNNLPFETKDDIGKLIYDFFTEDEV